MKSLKGHFLIAAPSLTESTFARTVVLMLQHDENGALGVVINRGLQHSVKQACAQVLETDCQIEGNLFQGGPCQEMLLIVLHGDEQVDPDDEPVLPGVYFSTDQATIEKIVNDPPEAVKFIVGYSGWAAGQLESELQSGSWLIAPATAKRVYGPLDRLWDRLLTEANLSQWIDPKLIPEDPTRN
jgi:putative transcriptional regulator